MKNNNNLKKLIVLAAATFVVVTVAFNMKDWLGKAGNSKNEKSSGISVVKDDDIVIPLKDVTETALFYPANINGTDLEVIAVKAPDGTVRTAFNTCQVCFSSGKGYYEQEGDKLVCQNCGNRFGMDEVEIARGGCNPVPITSEYKKIEEETITVSKDYLEQATAIFQNWNK